MSHHNLPVTVPEALAWLFTEEQPGRRVGYSFRCPCGQAIHSFHKDLPEVQKYTEELKEYHRNGVLAPRTSKLGAKRVLTAKNAMVKAVVRFYGGCELGSKEYLRRRIAVAEKDAAANLAAWRSASAVVDAYEAKSQVQADQIETLKALVVELELELGSWKAEAMAHMAAEAERAG